MIKGEINLHQEPTYTKNYSRYDNYGDYWDTYGGYEPSVPPNFDNLIESTVTDALKKGYHIGRKVMRKIGFSTDVGEIIHFDKSKKSYKYGRNWCECIVVRWGNFPHESSWHHEELNLLPENNNETA